MNNNHYVELSQELKDVQAKISDLSTRLNEKLGITSKPGAAGFAIGLRAKDGTEWLIDYSNGLYGITKVGDKRPSITSMHADGIVMFVIGLRGVRGGLEGV